MTTTSYDIGVLFCGGCNPTFDRQIFYSDLSVALHPLCKLSFFKNVINYDAILVINGCASLCLFEITFAPIVIFLYNNNLNEAVEKIRKTLLQL